MSRELSQRDIFLISNWINQHFHWFPVLSFFILLSCFFHGFSSGIAGPEREKEMRRLFKLMRHLSRRKKDTLRSYLIKQQKSRGRPFSKKLLNNMDFQLNFYLLENFELHCWVVDREGSKTGHFDNRKMEFLVSVSTGTSSPNYILNQFFIINNYNRIWIKDNNIFNWMLWSQVI